MPPPTSAPVPLSFEIEVQVQDALVKDTLESPLVIVFPLFIQNSKGYILIWRPSMESQDAGSTIIRGRILFDRERGSLALVYQIRVEKIEFIPLHNLWWWIVSVIMCFIVLVPVKSSVHPVEILWFSGTVLVVPPVHCGIHGHFAPKWGIPR